ncbi:MAG: EAL domain-containing protein [Romboutsia sp.]|nr:EAL domain-containing protein [Romboutsia sp.]
MSIALDDFGTGYSTFETIANYPINAIKIDQSFIKNMEHDHKKEKIIKSIIGLAKNIDIDIIAEGVETESQKDFLITLECDYLQGHIISKPLPYYDALALIEQYKL